MMELLNLDLWHYGLANFISTLPSQDYPKLIGLLVIVVLLAIRAAYIANKQRLYLKDTPRSKIRSAAQGYVEIYGHTAPISEEAPIVAPLSERPCTWYHYKVEEWRRSGKSSHWALLKEGCSQDLFLLHGATGTVVVDPIGAKYSMKRASTQKWRSGATDQLRKVMDSALFFNKISMFGFKRYRITETIVSPGESLMVLGFFRTVNPENQLTWRQGAQKSDPEYQTQLQNWQAYSALHNTADSKKQRINVVHQPKLSDEVFMLTNIDEAVLLRRLAWRVGLMASSSLFLLGLISFCLMIRPLF